jgi:hypothetical protein
MNYLRLIIIIFIFIFILLCLLYNKLYVETFESNVDNDTDIYAIHSIFIAKENILFLEQWIDYHIQLGFNKFYLYDNSKVQTGGGYHIFQKHFKVGKINKYNINYNKIVKLTDNEISDKLRQIQHKYKNVIIHEWSPKDKNGIIQFNQTDAINDCLKLMTKDGVKWCANIDMDEFIVINGNSIKEFINKLNPNVSAIIMEQFRFRSRFDNINKLVIDINNVEPINNTFILNGKKIMKAVKNIFRVKDTKELGVHRWYGNGKSINPSKDLICFNHYKMDKSSTKYNIYNNIDNKIKKIIHKNSKHYIKIQ